MLGDPALHTFIGGRPETLEELRARYARWAAGSPDPAVPWMNWAIRFDEVDRVVGTVQASISNGHAEVAWVVGTGWQGRGIATEAARGLVAWLSRAGVWAIVAHVRPANMASARVAWAVGLRPTGAKQDDEDEWAHTFGN